MSIRWTHPSIKPFAGKNDPVEVMLAHSRRVVLQAKDKGWSGPPFDPFQLAEQLRIKVIPTQEVLDARTIPSRAGPRIEFNPNRSPGRVRFSIAHELAHTFFPDCMDQARHRQHHTTMRADDWQLEMLCNVGAADILMPVGSFPELKEKDLRIDSLLELRKHYDVSVEALLMRVVRLTEAPAMMFAASRLEQGEPRGRYRIDYALPSQGLTTALPRAILLPQETTLSACTGIGFTATGTEVWPGITNPLDLQAVAIPPYPGHHFPRVVGVALAPQRTVRHIPRISYLIGDATAPRGTGSRIIAHIVNDRTPRWGGGFAKVVARTFPHVQQDFLRWTEAATTRLKLGDFRLCKIQDRLWVFSMVSQHGYGESTTPRIRYQALHDCLSQLAATAKDMNASIHMPRIGCGQAGGSWDIVSELLSENLCQAGLEVTVYDLPRTAPTRPSQGTLFF